MLHYRPVRLRCWPVSYRWPVRCWLVSWCRVVVIYNRPVLWRRMIINNRPAWLARLHRPVWLALFVNYFIVYGSVVVVYNRFIYHGSFVYHRAININRIPVNYCAGPAIVSHTICINVSMRIALYIRSARTTDYSYMCVVIMHVVNNSSSVYNGHVTAAVNVVVVYLWAGYITVRYKRPPVSRYVAAE